MLGRRELVSNPGHPGGNPRDRFDRLAHLFRNLVWRQWLSPNFQDVIPQTGKAGPTISYSSTNQNDTRPVDTKLTHQWLRISYKIHARMMSGFQRPARKNDASLDALSRAQVPPHNSGLYL
jgi:hypothetical protein